jgi:hypothetical protein
MIGNSNWNRMAGVSPDKSRAYAEGLDEGNDGLEPAASQLERNLCNAASNDSTRIYAATPGRGIANSKWLGRSNLPGMRYALTTQAMIWLHFCATHFCFDLGLLAWYFRIFQSGEIIFPVCLFY